MVSYQNHRADLAEAVGFEPTCPCGQLDFESSSLRPLRYASTSHSTNIIEERAEFVKAKRGGRRRTCKDLPEALQ